MKRKVLIGVIATVFVAVGLFMGNSNKEEVKEPTKPTVEETITPQIDNANKVNKTDKKKEVLMKQMEDILHQNMGNVTQKIEVYQEENLIVMDITPYAGFVTDVFLLGTDHETYKSLMKSYKEITASAKKTFEGANYDLGVSLMIRNDNNIDKAVIAILNGKVHYNYFEQK